MILRCFLKWKNEDFQLIFNKIIETPQNFAGWQCIHIKNKSLKMFRRAKDFLSASEEMLSSYLKGIEGELYIVEFEDVFFFCRNLDQKTLKGVSDHICTIFDPGAEVRPKPTIFSDLKYEYQRFTEHVISKSSLHDAFDERAASAVENC